MGMEDLMTKQQVADYLKVSIRQVERLVEMKRLIKSKQGRSTVFRKENLQKYVDEYVKDEV